jgi:capsular polysaccharide biosynthesis protein
MDYLACSPRDTALVETEMTRRASLMDSLIDGPTRVFLARKSFRHRKIGNVAEIEAIAKSFGFAIVYAEDLEFPDQARLLRRARHVVAPEGSSLFLRVFMGRGAKLCILNHQETEGVVLYNCGAAEKGLELTIITGPEAGERRGRSQDMDYVIDADILRDFLGTWFDAGAPSG